MNNLLDSPEALTHLFHPRKSSPTPLPECALDIHFSMDDDITIGCRLFTADKEASAMHHATYGIFHIPLSSL